MTGAVTKTHLQLNPTEVLEAVTSVGGFDLEKDTQICVTSRSGDDLFDGAGSINSYDANEWDFNKVNKQFLGTGIEGVLEGIESLGFTHGRVRIMNMLPKTTYSYHMDCEERMHFALKTNESNFFIVEDEVYRIPADGFGYQTNTVLRHTAVNSSFENRIHIVIPLLYRVVRKNNGYLVGNKMMSQEHFNLWLTANKPATDEQRSDYFFDD